MRLAFLFFACLCVALSTGCDVPARNYPPNEVYALVVATSRDVPSDLAAQDATEITDRLFGTPDEPRWPGELLDGDAADLVDVEQIIRCAGRVYSDQDNKHFGLYREHCVKCHGVSGGGDGPASLLQNPYPRDFRAGIFKWKSTERDAKPTRGDLITILKHGVPGSGMPSFATTSEDDIEALTDYVIYLSVRGEFEREILAGLVDEFGYEETRPDDIEPQELDELAADILNELVSEWAAAEQRVVPVPPEPPSNAESIARGEKLFHGKIANCVGCHGPGGNGEAITLDFDDWTREFTTKLSITPTDRDAVKPFRKAGALRPRQIHPRKLTSGVYRGGAEAETLYRRLVVGIAGSPMPAVLLSDEPSPTALTTDQVWDLVHYVRHLGADE